MPAFSYTYATLTTALRNFTEDQGSEFLAAIPTIIGLAETRLVRDLDLEIFDTVATGVFTVNNAFITKPANILQLRSLHYISASNEYVYLDEKAYEFLREYWSNPAITTATPKYYCEYSDTQWMIAGTPAIGLTWSARFIVRPDGLSDTNPTTWLSTRVPDALFYACLISSEQFLKADSRIGGWMGEYTRALEAARIELRRAERDDYMPMAATPVKEAE